MPTPLIATTWNRYFPAEGSVITSDLSPAGRTADWDVRITEPVELIRSA